jgi:hypothetical protein
VGVATAAEVAIFWSIEGLDIGLLEVATGHRNSTVRNSELR